MKIIDITEAAPTSSPPFIVLSRLQKILKTTPVPPALNNLQIYKRGALFGLKSYITELSKLDFDCTFILVTIEHTYDRGDNLVHIVDRQGEYIAASLDIDLKSDQGHKFCAKYFDADENYYRYEVDIDYDDPALSHITPLLNVLGQIIETNDEKTIAQAVEWLKLRDISEAAPTNMPYFLVMSRLDKALRSGPVPHALRNLQTKKSSKFGKLYYYHEETPKCDLSFYQDKLMVFIQNYGQGRENLYYEVKWQARLVGDALALTETEYDEFYKKYFTNVRDDVQWHQADIPYSDHCLLSLKPWLSAISAALSSNERIITLVRQRLSGHEIP